MAEKKFNIEWLSTKDEAEYWYFELEEFLKQAWSEIGDLYDVEDLRQFYREVDEILRKHKYGAIIEGILGATMIRRMLWSFYPEIDPSKKKKAKIPEYYDKEIERLDYGTKSSRNRKSNK